MKVELTSILNLDKISVSGMTVPKPEKLEYYERYFLEEGRFASDVIVDEAWNLRTGYVSYLLARKYGVRPQIFEIRAACPIAKVVSGKYVRYSAWEWNAGGSRRNSWVYALKEPVVPGDILRVEAGMGTAYMLVEKVEHAAAADCAHMQKALKHIRKRKK